MWQTLESDPGLFTELIERLGVENVEVRELLSLDIDSLKELGKVYGLLFLFKYRRREYADTGDDGVPAEQSSVVFAHQIAQNACATQAMLSVLLNTPNLDLGTQLTEFREFVEHLDPESRGDAIAMSEFLQTQHNFMCRPQLMVNEGPIPQMSEEDDGLYHYIAYVPTDQGLFELDGLKPAPVFHGASTLENMVEVVRRRMNRHMGDLRVSLLAVTQDMRKVYEERGQTDLLSLEVEKRARYTRENALRRASHTELVVKLLKQLARKSTDDEWNKLIKDGLVTRSMQR